MNINDCNRMIICGFNQCIAHDSNLITCWIVIGLQTLITLLTG